MFSSLGVHVAALPVWMTLAMGVALRMKLKSPGFIFPNTSVQVTSEIIVYDGFFWLDWLEQAILSQAQRFIPVGPVNFPLF